MIGDPPWKVRFRADIFGDAIEWMAKRIDASYEQDRPNAGTICAVIVNSEGLDAVLATNDGYLLQHEEFSSPGTLEDFGRDFDSAASALFGHMVESWGVNPSDVFGGPKVSRYDFSSLSPRQRS